MFSKALVLFSLAAMALGAVLQPVPEVVAQKFDIDADGAFQWSYQSADGSSQQQEGKQLGQDGGQAVQGVAQWSDPEGGVHLLQYVADQEGYRPSSGDLPTNPPIPEAILRSLAWNAAHPEEE